MRRLGKYRAKGEALILNLKQGYASKIPPNSQFNVIYFNGLGRTDQMKSKIWKKVSFYCFLTDNPLI